MWSVDAARAFRVTGPHGRVALHLPRRRRCWPRRGPRASGGGAVAGGRPGAGRRGARRAARTAARAGRPAATGSRVALAVALVGAAVGRGGPLLGADWRRSWIVTATVFLDAPVCEHVQGDAGRCGRAPGGLAAALRSLAVFPRDTPIPIAAIARYWRSPAVAARRDVADLDALAAAKLLQLDGDRSGSTTCSTTTCCCTPRCLADLHTALLAPIGRCCPPIPGRLVAAAGGGALHLGSSDRPPARRRRPRRMPRRSPTPPIWRGGSSAAGTYAAEADLALAADALPVTRRSAGCSAWFTQSTPAVADHRPTASATSSPPPCWPVTADRPTAITHQPRPAHPLLPNHYLQLRWGLTTPPTRCSAS